MVPEHVISDPLVALLDIVGHLDELGISYAIGGSVASSVHGEPRASADADLIAELTPNMLGRLLARIEETYYVSKESDKQWRDVLGMVKVQGTSLDFEYLREAAQDAGLIDLLDRAVSECHHDD